MMSLIMAAVAPGLALLCFFYLNEKFDTEPVAIVGRLFVLGVLLVFPVMVIQLTIQEALQLPPFLEAFMNTALLEEFFKWFILMFFVFHHVVFNQHYDGIVYSVAVSMGFATMENILYLWVHGVDHAMLRALLPVSSHALFGVVMGYYIGKAKFNVPSTVMRKYFFYSIILPVVLHGVYNYILILGQNWWQWVIAPFMIGLWWFSLRKVKIANNTVVSIGSSPSKNHDIGAY
ncbi:glutamic-type intramembrane protease PrsW [Caldalkalibacillus salinus]|uniref:glutamic-type intramembrane protease PrsW n=1 Tax=Caldalkalibacillus salinus TaxID=2803787 RepID=UPI0019248BD1|nr:glutamic-type intramembrane protease PrsW [Caldalkalibacillus salinus]